MNLVLTVIGTLAIVAITMLGLWRWSDYRADAAERTRLLTFQPTTPALFDPAMVADLPDPVRRYFLFSIAPDTPLYTVADVTMEGQFSMGTKEAPDYLDMTAAQTLAAPHGFVWQMQAHKGLMRISGSDSGIWTRFWLMGLVPVARMGGNPDHSRAAFGRYVAEAVFWTPAALLPGPGIRWEEVDNNTARVTISNGALEQAVDVTVDPEGRPVAVQFMRWSDANPEKIWRLQPFGGDLSAFKTFAGFTVPTHVEAGNFYGTDAYFPFFIADVEGVAFLTAP